MDPDKPNILNFYVPIINPGHPAAVQGNISRIQLFSTSYANYEKQIIRQMNELFAVTGFRAKKEITGIVLNRWDHAYLMPEPGFFMAEMAKGPPIK